MENITDTEETVGPDAERVGGKLGIVSRVEIAKVMGEVGFNVKLERESAIDHLDEQVHMQLVDAIHL